MPSTPITPPRVPIIDPRTGLIDRAWYMFFLSLYQSATDPNVIDVEVQFNNTSAIEQISELSKAFQSTLIEPDNASAIEQIGEFAKKLQSILVSPDSAALVNQISELAKQLKAFQVEPINSALLEQIAALRNEVQSFYLLPSSQSTSSSITGGVTSVDGSGGATGLTLTGGPITTTGTLTLGGTLAVASGGTGTATPSIVAGSNVTVSGSWPNQTINSSGTGVTTFSAGTTGFTPSTATAGAVTLAGTLAIANGGTGATSFASAGLPTLSGNNTFTGPNNFSGASNYFRAIAFTTSDGSTGNNAYFGENSAYATIGGVNGVVLASGATFPGTGRYVGDSVSWRPFVDATYSCGTGSQRWSSMHTVNLAVSGTVTSGTWNGTAIGTAYGGTGSTSTTFVNLATNVTGTLPAANGGTGAASLTAAGIVTLTDTQTITGAKSFTSYTSQFRGITYATTNGASASNAYLGEDSAYAVVGGANGVVLASGATYPGTGRYVGDTVSWRPFADNTYSLGTGPQRWTAVYAVNGTIQTSDGNEKQQIAELDAAELAVGRRIKGLIRKFKFNDSVTQKGDAARIHVGVIAQDVRDAFIAEGLDPNKYGMFCSDTFDTPTGSQTRLGVRYDELLAFVLGSL